MSIGEQNTDTARILRKPGARRRRLWVRLLMWLLAPPVFITGAFQLQPTYIVLDIPVTPNATGYFWWEEQRSQLAYADSGGVLYLRRQVGTAYGRTQGWQTEDEIFAFFDRWLAANGWTFSGVGVNAPPLPESRFLKREQGRRYRRTTDRDIEVTVAAWPIGGSVEGFNVVLTTERPSWGRRLSRGFD